jgi:GMP synthase (glutamine-hydrolysing)
MAKPVLVVQHVPSEGPDRIAAALASAGLAYETVLASDGLKVAISPFSGLVVMGGPMGVYEGDRYPFLVDEQRLIRGALASRVPVLGVCLGSQLLAAALGARVQRSGAVELGWGPVVVRPEASKDRLFGGLPQSFDALHWHGDVFGLPEGAVPLASSSMTEHQAFSFRDLAWGILFHLEVTLDGVRAMCAAFPEDLARAGVHAAHLLERSALACERVEPLAARVFGAWAVLTQ